MNSLIILATEIERQAFASVFPMHNLHKGYWQLDNGPVDVFVSGLGKIPTTIACTRFLSSHKYLHALNIGACGLISDKKLETIIINGIYDWDQAVIGKYRQFRKTISLDEDLLPRDVSQGFLKFLDNRKPYYSSGCLLTSDQFVNNEEEAQHRYNCSGAVCVDMEGSAILEVCKTYEIDLSMIKVVSDGAGQTDGGDPISWDQQLENLFLKAKPLIIDYFNYVGLTNH